MDAPPPSKKLFKNTKKMLHKKTYGKKKHNSKYDILL